LAVAVRLATHIFMWSSSRRITLLFESNYFTSWGQAWFFPLKDLADLSLDKMTGYFFNKSNSRCFSCSVKFFIRCLLTSIVDAQKEKWMIVFSNSQKWECEITPVAYIVYTHTRIKSANPYSPTYCIHVQYNMPSGPIRAWPPLLMNHPCRSSGPSLVAVDSHQPDVRYMQVCIIQAGVRLQCEQGSRCESRCESRIHILQSGLGKLTDITDSLFSLLVCDSPYIHVKSVCVCVHSHS
jgi:hypothetical protein